MSQSINTLREHLFAALQGVKDGTLDLEKARAINELSKTLVSTAKVEVDYLRVTGAEAESPFLTTPQAAPELPKGITSVLRHIAK